MTSGTKQYERTELLDRAVALFRRKGFNGTSTAELVAELGVNRKSMYAEFGSKLGLFEAALERYDDRNLSMVLSPLEAPDAGADGIRQAFAGYASASEGRVRGLGCLLCNTAVEKGSLDPAIESHVEAYFARLKKAFHHTLGNAERAGEIQAGTDLDELAAFFVMAIIGVAAIVRAEAPSDQVHAACRVATSVLDANRPVTLQ